MDGRRVSNSCELFYDHLNVYKNSARFRYPRIYFKLPRLPLNFLELFVDLWIATLQAIWGNRSPLGFWIQKQERQSSWKSSSFQLINHSLHSILCFITNIFPRISCEVLCLFYLDWSELSLLCLTVPKECTSFPNSHISQALLTLHMTLLVFFHGQRVKWEANLSMSVHSRSQSSIHSKGWKFSHFLNWIWT